MKMLYYLDEPSELEGRWQHGATKLSTGVAGAFSEVYFLGRLDCALRNAAPDFADFSRTIQVGGSAAGWFDYWFLSQLWVFGAYEIIRTLDQRISKAHPCKDQVKNLKRHLERVRMPLAKLEPRVNVLLIVTSSEAACCAAASAGESAAAAG